MPKSKKGTEESSTTPSGSSQPVESSKSNKKSSPSSSKKNSDIISYKIRMLDSDQPPLEISISKNDNGQVLFNKVCDELGGIVERDYFGLRFMDKHNQRQWLDLGVNVKKQMTGSHSSALSFRVKHYPGNPISDFHQEISQYLLYLQIRRDLVQGRLLCPLSELYTLGALILQSEYGDAPSADDGELNGSPPSAEDQCAMDPDIYFKNFKIVFNQTRKIESEILNRYVTLRGLTARDAEVEVLKRASKLPTYGVDPFPVKIITKEKSSKKPGQKTSDAASAKTAPTGDVNANALPPQDGQSAQTSPPAPSGSVYLGLRHTGLTTYVGLQPSENFDWDTIGRLACDGRDFIVYLKPDSELADQKKRKKRLKPRVVTFRCESKAAALALWKWTVDRKSFFTLKKASEAKVTKTSNSFFRRSHSYRFIGKSQMELKSITNSAESLPQPAFVRVSSLRRSPRSHDGDFDAPSARATLPARIRSSNATDSAVLPATDPAKRRDIAALQAAEVPEAETTLSTVNEQAGDAAATSDNAVMNVANDLRALQPDEADTPIKPVQSAAVAACPPTTSAPVSADSVDADVNEADETSEVRLRPNHTASGSADRDSDCLRAVKEIDQVIDSVHQANGHQKQPLPNGEMSRERLFDTKPSNRTLVYAMEAAAVFGLVCFGVLVAALETHPVTDPGRQVNFWTRLAMQLRGQPFVASFNEYIYAPLRGFLVGGGR
uniref:FERM domain-containing protein n=1 Tax=Mesocestoides corti TaxID=53468 RepID=A0A5K3F6C9_MESCO